MKRKRKESCPSPILDDSPKRTKVQAQRKFAQNSGVHSPILTPIRDLETTDLLPHTNVLPEPVELLPMKRPNTEDFLTFLCFRGTPILPSNLQFFNTASIVSDGQVHEIKGDSPKNGPIDISKCAASSSDKPFIAFGVRKRADPIVISRQMERKRRHALAIQALRRKYQEQKMAKIRALTISKLSEKTTNKTLVRTNTIQKTETVTKKTNTLQKTKVIATKHVKVTTQTLKTKVKPKMCLRSFGGKFVQKELPFRARKALQERDSGKKRSDMVKSVVRTSKNSNKPEGSSKKVQHITKSHIKPVNRVVEIKQKIKASSNARVTRSGSITTVIRNPTTSALVKRPQVKRRILMPSTTISLLKPKLRSTTTKKSVISRKKAQQRIVGVNKSKGEKSPKHIGKTELSTKDYVDKLSEEIRKSEKEVKKRQEKDSGEKLVLEGGKKLHTGLKKPEEIPKRVTRKDSELAVKSSCEKQADKNDLKKEVIKNLELKREVKIAETSAKKEVKKNVSVKREFKLKSNSKDIKKNVDLKKTSNMVLEKNDEGHKVKRDTKTVEITVNKIVTRKSEEAKPRESNQHKEKDKKTINKSSGTNISVDKKSVPNSGYKKSLRNTNKANIDAEKKDLSEEAVEKSKKGTKISAKGNFNKKKSSDSVRIGSETFNSKKSQFESKQLASTIEFPSQDDTLQYFPLEQKNLESKLLEAETGQNIFKEVGKNDVSTGYQTTKGISDEQSSTKKTAAKRTIKKSPKEVVEKPASAEVKEVVSDPILPDLEETNKKSKETTSKLTPIEKIVSKKVSEESSVLDILTKTVPNEHFIETKLLDQENIPKTLNRETAMKDRKSADHQLDKTHELKRETNESSTIGTGNQNTKNNSEENLASKKASEDGGAAKKRTRKIIDNRTLMNERTAISSSEDELVSTLAVKNTLKKVSKQESSVKRTPKEEVSKRKLTPKREDLDQIFQKASPRPSRKTKEAAAIYMEILSHKLVNDGTVDDDNISIDSFPELPNVKKTEQREIELKAQAKTSKDEEGKIPQISEKVEEKKGKKVSKSKKDVKELVGTQISESKDNIKSSECDIIKDSSDGTPKNMFTDVNSPNIDKTKYKSSDRDISPLPSNKLEAVKSQLGKRKSNPSPISSDSDSDNEVLLAKVRKCEAQKCIETSSEKNIVKNIVRKQENPVKSPVEEEGVTRRQTRRSTQAINESESDASDESFHIDIRVPRKKKATRSHNKACTNSFNVLEKNVDIILEAARVLEGEKVLETQKENTEGLKPTSIVERIDKPDVEKHIILDKHPQKLKLIEEKNAKSLCGSVKAVEQQENLKKSENVTKEDKSRDQLSDSDESTTSDINLKSLQVRQRNKKLTKTKSTTKSSAASFSDSDEEPLAKLTARSATTEPGEGKKKSVKNKLIIRKTADKCLAELAVMEPKAKRECTKRPSNYLPMLSSSDEEDEPFFHGFNTAKEELHKPKTFVQSLAPSLDLLSQDIGRKGKVNMSNEQIEQWLKDSALAGSSVAKENDAMLKFGEKIPTETSLTECSESSNISNLKSSDCEEVKTKQTDFSQPCSSKTRLPEEKSKNELKSPLNDRKWIFKKEKKEVAPNKNAFSPENECSVYAFGEENEDVISTPFRRPSRRPSSTATSRSEDELLKIEESSKQSQFRKPGLQPSDSEDSRCFNIPQNPTKLSKTSKSESMVPPSTSFHSKRPAKSSVDRAPEPFDDFKYKVPSSPSASSGSSTKLYKKGTPKPKGKTWEVISPVYVSDFPKPTDLPKLVEAPIFHPTEQEFQDPLEYIERIRHKAEQFGICKIVPPSSFKPECKVSDDMRFTAYNQYVHKMLHRWGPNFKEFMVIKKYLTTQNIPLKTPPLIGGMEIDLPRLYQTVQSLGGLKEVIEKKKWSKVSDHMKIPKLAQDRVTKLDDIYCKYLLPYDTLSPAEREKLFDEVETYWAKRESKSLQLKSESKSDTKPEELLEQDEYESDDNETEECTVKSKNMALNSFYRIARNTMAMYFKVPEPSAQEVEQEFWRYVTQKQNHICVHSASIDCGNWGYGFAVSKNSPFARHPWNLKVMSNNPGSVLRSLGPVMGVTIPTLHVGMVFSACCWYRDPHGLPWVEYLHTGGNKIWYGIPSSSCDVFQAAMRKLVPNYCRDKELWLPSDTAMVPPGLLMEHNVSLCRTVQEPGQFLVVFPKVYTSSVSTGYVVSESIYFAPLYWLRTARSLFNSLRNSCEPSMFSLDKLLISIATDAKSSTEVLRVVMPFMEELCTRERNYRVKLRNVGKIEEEKITSPEVSNRKKKMLNVEDVECEICRTNLYISMVIDTQDDLIYCLEHAVDLARKNNKIMERFKLRYAYEESELENMLTKIDSIIEAKLLKKVPSKYAGLPTLLK